MPQLSGITRKIQFNDHLTVSMLANRRKVAPHGLQGGEDGRIGENYVETKDGDTIKLSHRGSVQVVPGDKIIIKTPGGGGFGEK